MKLNFFCFFYFLYNLGFTQTSNDDAVYLDSLHNIGTEDNFKYIRIIKDYYTSKDTYLVSDFYKSGKLEMRGTTKDKNILKLDGTCIYYYENGNKKQISNYADSNLNGKQFEWYENGILIDGVSIDSSKTEHYYKTIEYNGIPKKGMKAFYNYIEKNLRIPAEVSKNNITGKIYVTFFIEKDGSIKDVKIIRDIRYDTGKEVIRIIKNYKDWNPSTFRGIGIKKKYSLPITISSTKQFNSYPGY